MPLYVISHKDEISPSQRDELAAAITKTHTTLFTTPSLFVNVKFEDVSDTSYYVGGKRVGTSREVPHLSHSAVVPSDILSLLERSYPQPIESSQRRP